MAYHLIGATGMCYVHLDNCGENYDYALNVFILFLRTITVHINAVQ